ncbi:hydrogenase maturation protease [candidate division WOR-3 bacterium]|nr:hydrogenase maturation protease [candidate division WOR-3 bacterium]
MRTLVFGLGNPILSDDGIGIRVVQEIRNHLPAGKAGKSEIRNQNTEIEFKEGSIGGLSILDEIDGYDRLVIIDSIKTEKGKLGEVYKLEIPTKSCGRNQEIASTHLSNSHGIDFLTAIKLGKKVGYKIPKIIDIYAIEVENNTTFNEKCTGKVEASIPRIAQEIMREII